MDLIESTFSKKLERKLVWLIRIVIFFCFLSGALTSLAVLVFMDKDWSNAVALVLGVVLSLVFMWHANTSLKAVLEYEGKVIWFVMFARKILKPIKEMEDAEKDKAE